MSDKRYRVMRVPLEFWNTIDMLSRKGKVKKMKILRKSAVIIDRADRMTELFFGRKQ
jgi:hypothetical protein